MKQEWQPIETAPRNDDDVLLFCADQSSGEQFVGFRHDKHHWQYALMDCGLPIVCRPTHWMPLPDPPKE